MRDNDKLAAALLTLATMLKAPIPPESDARTETARVFRYFSRVVDQGEPETPPRPPHRSGGRRRQ